MSAPLVQVRASVYLDQSQGLVNVPADREVVDRDLAEHAGLVDDEEAAEAGDGDGGGKVVSNDDLYLSPSSSLRTP